MTGIGSWFRIEEVWKDEELTACSLLPESPMSKYIARRPQSYANEKFVSAQVPELLQAKGFNTAKVCRRRGMKLVEAKDTNGGLVVFWLKQGWSDHNYSAIQFGMFKDISRPETIPDSVFIDRVAAYTEGAKSRGATHVLMVHMVGLTIQNYVALKIDDVPVAYRRQIKRWPTRARNTKVPTLYFEDSRNLPEALCVVAVTDLEIPLEIISGLSLERGQVSRGLGAKKVTAQIERRLQQQKFRVLIGERFGWRCMVSGISIPEVLDAAHLPGRDWRFHNEPTDGILIRVDLHRLLDQGLAELRDGKFWIAKSARKGEYAEYHGRVLKLD